MCRSINIETDPSPPLASDTDYDVTVSVWDASGATGSSTARFSTAFTDPTGDFGSSQWISPPPVSGAVGFGFRLFRSEFTLDFVPIRARLYVATGNYWKAFVNGAKVSTHELGTFTTFEKRVLYGVVTLDLNQGSNVLGLSLGNGWYSQDSVDVGQPTVRAVITAQGASGERVRFVSNAGGSFAASALELGELALNFTAGQSPVTYDDIYIGETYDASLEQPGWNNVNFVPPAGGLPWVPAEVTNGGAAGQASLSLWTLPVTVDESFPALSVNEPLPDTFVIDFGQNMAGFITMAVPQFAVPGSVIRLSHAEILHPDGTINDVYRNAPMQANYTVGPNSPGTSYTVQFTYMGFRYVQVTGFPGVPTREDFTAHFVHSPNRRTGQFSSDSDELNSIAEITRYAAMSNQMDIPTDCPQRERRGWMGDAQLSCEVVLTTQEAGAFYSKFVRDIADSQAFLSPSGAVPDCVPWYHHGGLPADPAWGVAAALIPRWAASYLDDVRIVQRQYASVKAYADSELARTAGGILDGSRYGDWCAVYDSLSEGCAHRSSAVSTFYLIAALDTVADFAAQLGNSADAANYTSLAASARKSFIQEFYHASNNSFNVGTEMDLLLPLATPDVGLTQPQLDGLAATLVARITNGSAFPNHPTGGIVYTKLLWPVLDAIGRSDLGLTMMLAGPAKPGFDEMVNQTATTLWESWDMDEFNGGASRNHIMFGGASGLWPYTTVAGLRRQGTGWSQMRVEPAVAALSSRISTATGSIDSPVGLFESSWDNGDAAGVCVANVAENTDATFTCLGPDGTLQPGHVFTGVEFASFGTPTGSCSSGFANSTCNANTSVPLLAAACVGKNKCSISVSDDVFGDPCYDVVKHFNARLAGSCEQVVIQQAVTFPANTAGAIVVAVGNASTATISESGTTVWVAGAYVPGVAGITGARAVTSGVEFSVGSGEFLFHALGEGASL